MEWGIHPPHLGRQASRLELIRFAQRAEELGFHSGWVSDHIAWPLVVESKYPYSDDGSVAAGPDMPWLDPIGTMFFVPVAPSGSRWARPCSSWVYRLPVLTAKAFASLDVLSGGRVNLGVGVDHVLLDPVARGGLDGRMAAMERFMTEVAPCVG